MRFLYLPILEAGNFHDNAVKQKRGLYNALSKYGEVLEWDYLANDADTRYQGLINRIEEFKPTHVFTQFHAADVITPDQMIILRDLYPDIIWINWSGDSWDHSLIAEPILNLARQYDLWLVAAPAVLPIYESKGIHAKYSNIAYEYPLLPLPEMPTYNVVFLANVINEKRRGLMEYLRTIPESVGIYGDWEHADGHNTYNFSEGEALYKNARIAIADNVYQDQQTYISNRPMQVMMAKGALLLHQRVPGMEMLSGWIAGEHYIEWQTVEDLSLLIQYWLKPENEAERLRIVNNAYEFTSQHHTFDARVDQLVNEFLPEIPKRNQ